MDHYKSKSRKKPTDCHWRKFQPELSSRFHSLCGYCEECCKGEVDHFRPKAHFPDQVYEWNNWVLACSFCNNTKREKWPDFGYVDPCESSKAEAPESYFAFDLATTEIIPRPDLPTHQRLRAQTMIDDLALNSYHHLKKRTQWLVTVARAIEHSSGDERENLISYIVSRDRELSSLSHQFLRESGLLPDEN